VLAMTASHGAAIGARPSTRAASRAQSVVCRLPAQPLSRTQLSNVICSRVLLFFYRSCLLCLALRGLCSVDGIARGAKLRLAQEQGRLGHAASQHLSCRAGRHRAQRRKRWGPTPFHACPHGSRVFARTAQRLSWLRRHAQPRRQRSRLFGWLATGSCPRPSSPRQLRQLACDGCWQRAADSRGHNTQAAPVRPARQQHRACWGRCSRCRDPGVSSAGAVHRPASGTA
jgi:hypothetical protein